MRIYLDNCCFNRPFDDQSQIKIRLEAEAKMFIQSEILNGKHQLVWSYILDFENQENPFEQRKETIQIWREVAEIDIDESKSIIKSAERIELVGIKPKDALHIACAINAECECFITTDMRILNKPIEGILIVDPIRFIRLMEEREND